MTDFEKDLTRLINAHSIENMSDTPDHILADYLVRCLEAFARVTRARDAWFGFNTWSKGPPKAENP